MAEIYDELAKAADSHTLRACETPAPEKYACGLSPDTMEGRNQTATRGADQFCRARTGAAAAMVTKARRQIPRKMPTATSLGVNDQTGALRNVVIGSVINWNAKAQ
jgi:hypothetical protein